MKTLATDPATLSRPRRFYKIVIFQSITVILLVLLQVTTRLLRTRVVTCSKTSHYTLNFFIKAAGAKQ